MGLRVFFRLAGIPPPDAEIIALPDVGELAVLLHFPLRSWDIKYRGLKITMGFGGLFSK